MRLNARATPVHAMRLIKSALLMIPVLSSTAVAQQYPTNPKPAGFKKLTPQQVAHIEKAIDVLWNCDLPISGAIVKLDQKLEDGTIGAGPRPANNVMSQAYTAPNTYKMVDGKLVGVFSSSDTGNYVVAPDALWNADSTYKVEGLKQQEECASIARLASILIHEMKHVCETNYVPSVCSYAHSTDIKACEKLVLDCTKIWTCGSGAGLDRLCEIVDALCLFPNERDMAKQKAIAKHHTAKKPN